MSLIFYGSDFKFAELGSINFLTLLAEAGVGSFEGSYDFDILNKFYIIDL